MVNSFDINVCYLCQTRVFHIKENILSVGDINDLIGTYFHVDLNVSLLEIFDARFDLPIVLDEYYLDRIRSDPYFAVSKSLPARIRSRYDTLSDIQFFTDSWSTYNFEETKVQPDHIIVWLDAYISHVGDYVQLKSYFNSITAIDGLGTLSVKTNWDIYNLINACSLSFNDYSRKYTGNMLKTFSNIRDCLEFIQTETASKKKLFFISSNTLSREIIPNIVDNKCVYSIYILFDFVTPFEAWTQDYFDRIPIIPFEHELDLLTRLTRDIATYYEDKSLDNINPYEKLSYLKWARTLYMNADMNDQQLTPLKILQDFEKRIMELEDNLKRNKQYEDEEKSGVECDER